MADLTLKQAIEGADLVTRMRWWAELNCYRVPHDFPVPINGDGEHGAAFNAVGGTLTHAETSLGWWIYELKKTPEEWQDWWTNQRRCAGAQAAIQAYTTVMERQA